MIGKIEEKIKVFSDVIYEHCKEKFGVADKVVDRQTEQSGRQREIGEIRKWKTEARRQ